MPGIERSTGYYNDQNQTIFLYVGDVDDAATRRHEMVHQLFREATRSSLRQDRMPAEQSGFWLIEGIAGYFESLKVGDRVATVGGWDASRLQFARYRTLALADVMPMEELERDGRRCGTATRGFAALVRARDRSNASVDGWRIHRGSSLAVSTTRRKVRDRVRFGGGSLVIDLASIADRLSAD